MQESADALRKRSPIPRRPGLERRPSPSKPDLSPSTSNRDRWSHDGEASDAAAAIAHKERLAADEAKQRQVAEEQAAAEEAERTRQVERARLEAAAEQQHIADQRRILEKAEKQLQTEEKHAAKQVAREAERQRVAAEERRLDLEQKQAAAAQLSREPSLQDRISLRSNVSSHHEAKRRRSPSVVRSQTFSSSDTQSRSPSVDRRDRHNSAVGHRKHGGRLRSFSPPRWTAQSHHSLVLSSYVRSVLRIAIGCQEAGCRLGLGRRLGFCVQEPEVQTTHAICQRQYTWHVCPPWSSSTADLSMNLRGKYTVHDMLSIYWMTLFVYLDTSGTRLSTGRKKEATGKQTYVVPVGPKLYRILSCK